jgi:hypothetical protein
VDSVQLAQAFYKMVTSQDFLKLRYVPLCSTTGDLGVKMTRGELLDKVGSLANQACFLKFNHKQPVIAYTIACWHYTRVGDEHIRRSPYAINRISPSKESRANFLACEVARHLQNIQPVTLCQ